MKDKALQYLRDALGKSDATFRPGQWESVDALLDRQRLLVVERTGWGKSMVYFLATRLMRDQGFGVTLLVSPLLSLMRNQLVAAARIGIIAETVNSTNHDKWEAIHERMHDGQIDILLVSPERLANQEFMTTMLAPIADSIGLFVIDEAHCISDWGHDFRPDYRRIASVLQSIPPNVPVLATTATANNRVVEDVKNQIGTKVKLIRGPLVRESLKLQNITMPSPAARMAWLAETIPKLPGSGIIYTLTQRDAERVARWLRDNDIDAEAYHAGVEDKDDALSIREQLEEKLLESEVKALVATVALGMGFDKPDLGFVIHYQRPGSVVHYYQQVGRAGRAVEEAYGILLHGEEDEQIGNYFIHTAFPTQKHAEDILGCLNGVEGGLSISELEASANLSHSTVEKVIKYLSVESPSPITKISSKWNATAAAEKYTIDHEKVAAITTMRIQEQAEMQAYMEHNRCLMEFLANALDDPESKPCGRCAGCLGQPLLPTTFSDALANKAAVFLRRSHQPLSLRRKWPSGDPLPTYGFRGKITAELMASEGRALSLWRDAGWGQQVAAGKYVTGRFDDALVGGCVEMINEWQPTPLPTWVTCIPSSTHPELVPDFAARLADALAIPFVPAISKVGTNRPQKEMQNSFHQAQNLDGVFEVDAAAIPKGPCYLVDDVIHSGWTFTIAAALLRQAGCPAVFPLALTMNSTRMD